MVLKNINQWRFWHRFIPFIGTLYNIDEKKRLNLGLGWNIFFLHKKKSSHIHHFIKLLSYPAVLYSSCKVPPQYIPQYGG